MRFVARGHVRETGAKLEEAITASSASKARQMAQEWAQENALTFDGIETEDEHADRNSETGFKVSVTSSDGELYGTFHVEREEMRDDRGNVRDAAKAWLGQEVLDQLPASVRP